jgi:hypothetical protein
MISARGPPTPCRLAPACAGAGRGSSSHSLLFFWAVNGSSTWHKEKVAGTGTTYSAPSMTTDGSDVNIAAEGAKGSLDFYYAANGSATWNAETVADGNTTFSAPSMTTDGNDVNIAAAGANGSLDFYWAANGSATWNPEQVAPPGTLG